jgi:DNA-binding transcriptional MerR regulator
MLTIGELAAKTEVTIRTLRYYDKIGLLNPRHYKEGGHRLYQKEDVMRLQQIQSLKLIGFSLKEIKSLLDKSSVEQETLHIAIDSKLAHLKEERNSIEKTISAVYHIKTVTSNHQNIDLRLFCFVLYSLLWNEREKHSQSELFIQSFTEEERKKLDQQYFTLYTELKYLAAKDLSPSSSQARQLYSNIQDLISRTIIEDKFSPTSLAISNEIFNPFTEKELRFLKSLPEHQKDQS